MNEGFINPRLQLEAQVALYGLAGPSLVRLTGDFGDDQVRLQWVHLASASEEEIEDYRCVGTEIVANYSTATIDEQFVAVEQPADAADIPPREVALFSRNLNPEY